FFGILVEHYAGAFPPWLAPVQAVGIPIADAHIPYLEKVAARLREHGIRVEVDDGADRMQKKIRNAQRQKVPYMLLAGDGGGAGGVLPLPQRRAEKGRAGGGGDRRDRQGGGRPRPGLTAGPAVVRGSYAATMSVPEEPVERDGAGVPDGLQRLWSPHRMAYIK